MTTTPPTSPQPPEGHEILPAPFLRQHGAQRDMKFKRQHPEAHWHSSDLGPEDNHWWMSLPEFEADITNFVWCAPLGTMAAATTPLPVRCVVSLGDLWAGGCAKCGKRGEWGIASQKGPEGCKEATASGEVYCLDHLPQPVTYRHILPGALAALPEKPGDLIVSRAGLSNWDTIEQFFGIATWTDYRRWLQLDTEHAYAIPAPSVPAGQEDEWKPINEAAKSGDWVEIKYREQGGVFRVRWCFPLEMWIDEKQRDMLKPIWWRKLRCNCKWDGGHEPTCNIVWANEHLGDSAPPSTQPAKGPATPEGQASTNQGLVDAVPAFFAFQDALEKAFSKPKGGDGPCAPPTVSPTNTLKESSNLLNSTTGETLERSTPTFSASDAAPNVRSGGTRPEGPTDGEMLDWLEKATDPAIYPQGHIMVRSGRPCETINLRSYFTGWGQTLRSAIAAAMKGEGK